MPLLKFVHWIALFLVITFFFISNTNNTDAFLRRFLNNHTKTDSLIGFRNIYNSFWMLGYCAEYDSAGGLVQDNYDLECQQRHPPCPALYNSAKAYQCKLWFLNFLKILFKWFKSINNYSKYRF